MDKIIKQAAAFAQAAHEGKFRKGTDIPYFEHVKEAGEIVATLTDDSEIIAAAYLHDIIEDTRFTYEDLHYIFGERIADLVADESEDKMEDIPAEDSWVIRKERALQHLKNASKEAQMIALGDKLSNMRLTYLTHKTKGAAMWQAFNQKDEAMQAWYYCSLRDILRTLEYSFAWQELNSYCNEVFGEK